MRKFNSPTLLLLIIFAYSLIQGSFYPFLILIFSLLHEGGHILAIYLLGGRSSVPNGKGQGFSIDFSGLTYKKEFLAAFAGPFINLFLAGFFLIFAADKSKIMLHYCAYANFMLAGINLLPIFPMDGGRMLSCALAYRIEPHKRASLLRLIGIISLIILLILALWQFFISGYNISLLLICFYLAALIAAQAKGDFS